MNRNISILLVTLFLFTTIYFFSQDSKDKPLQEEIVNEDVLSIYCINKNVKKGELVDRNFISIIDVKESELSNLEYIDSNNEIPSGSVYKTDLKEGEFLSQSKYLVPGDNDYISFLLDSDELPYLYENVSSFTAKSLNLNSGDRISFISTMSSESNVLISGYDDINNVTSKIVINNARVLQVLREKKEETDEENTSIVVALKPKEILKLEFSRKISEVSIIPSSFKNKNLKVEINDILESKIRVRELRGKY